MHQQADGDENLPAQGKMINEVFSLHYQAALRTAYRFLRSKEDAADAVQTAYSAAFQNLNGFRGESSFKTWITRIVMNCCLIQLRERRTRRHVALDDLQSVLESREATPEALCYLAELQVAHKWAASRLPQKLKDVYASSLMADVPFPLVAQDLGLTTSAAKARLFRARRKVERSFQSVIQGRAA